MVIEKINSDKIEATLENIFEMSSKLRVLQEDLENINKSLKDVNFDFISGKISKEMYQDSKKELGNKRKIIIDKTNKMVNDILSVSKGLPELISKNKI